mgnify:CR=1 FL=1
MVMLGELCTELSSWGGFFMGNLTSGLEISLRLLEAKYCVSPNALEFETHKNKANLLSAVFSHYLITDVFIG